LTEPSEAGRRRADIDRKATAEIQTEQRHRYVIEAPAQLTREQWIETYSPKRVEVPPTEQ
jgi:hypothetical protein